MAFNYSSERNLKLAAELVAHLRINIKNTTGQEEWSQRNFALLRSFAIKNDARGCPTAGADRQFLWDFIAYKQGAGILLAAESEHSKDDAELVYDFEKLLYVRCPLKLMMCRITSASDARSVVKLLSEYMRDACSEYSAGEVYIIYGIWWDEGTGNRDKAFLFQVPGEPNHTMITEATFDPV